MRLRRHLLLFAIGLAVTIAAGRIPGRAAQNATTPAAGLRIVVIEGEDAVNVIQQKTAVAPVVEVRDRNDQPVAGAVVNFTIRAGRATFGGARTLSVTTNAAGRAVAAGFSPTGGGALQIGASAAFQGQTAAVTIAQTNVLTAAQAAAASGASGAGGTGGGAAGAGGGAGGGLSGATIGAVGAAAAGGTLFAVKELGDGGGATTYTGTFSGTLLMNFGVCTRSEAQTGTLVMEMTEENGAVSGTARVQGDIVLSPGPCTPANALRDTFGLDSVSIASSGGSVTFGGTQANQFPPSGGSSGGTNAYAYTFTGTKGAAEITGRLTVVRTITPSDPSLRPGQGSIAYDVVLR